MVTALVTLAVLVALGVGAGSVGAMALLPYSTSLHAGAQLTPGAASANVCVPTGSSTEISWSLDGSGLVTFDVLNASGSLLVSQTGTNGSATLSSSTAGALQFSAVGLGGTARGSVNVEATSIVTGSLLLVGMGLTAHATC